MGGGYGHPALEEFPALLETESSCNCKVGPRRCSGPCDADKGRSWHHTGASRGAAPGGRAEPELYRRSSAMRKNLLASNRNSAQNGLRGGTQGKFWLKSLKNLWVSLDPAPQESASPTQLCFCLEGLLLQWPRQLQAHTLLGSSPL